MDAHTTSHGHGADHAHPTPMLYGKVAVVLFVLTALEVLAYELARRPGAPMHEFFAGAVVPILIVLSAAKFALVAMFYMHLKQDSKLFTNLFVWPIFLAAAVILFLIVLMGYWLTASY
ncbi:MAG: cytochrome C oxidase subunit IV family protein [Gemmatimonadales bacterium]